MYSFLMFLTAVGSVIMITVKGLPLRSFSAKKVSTRSEYRSLALPMIENFAALFAADDGSSLQLELV